MGGQLHGRIQQLPQVWHAMLEGYNGIYKCVNCLFIGTPFEGEDS